MKSMGRWIIVIVILGLLGGGGEDLRGFFHSLDEGVTTSYSAERVKTHTKAAPAGDCRRVKGPVSVYLDPKKYPYTVRHAKRSFELGYPRVWHLDRANAERNREENLRGIPTRPGYDRDEAPPAATREGADGASHVAYVPSADNRGAGSVMGNQLSDYCDGQKFKLVFRDR